MARQNITPSWLQSMASLLSGKRQRPHRMTRRLRGERLENRTVLAVAPVPVEESEGESLAEYIAEDHALGPVAPAEMAAPSDQNGQSPADTLAPAGIDQFFGDGQGVGQGEGEGSGSGSGSGSGTSSGSGSPPDEPPIVSGDTTTDENGAVTASGSISDDGGMDDLSVSYDGPGTFSIDENGNFTIDFGTTEGSGVATITVTDSAGQTTTYDINY